MLACKFCCSSLTLIIILYSETRPLHDRLVLTKYSFDQSVKKNTLIIIPTLVQRFTGRLQLNLPCAWLITYLEFLRLCEAMNDNDTPADKHGTL